MLTISICMAFFGSKNIDAYGQVFFMLTTFPVIGILYKLSFNQFSDGIEYKRPDLFDKYKMTFGVVRRINGFEIFNNSDFDKLDELYYQEVFSEHSDEDDDDTNFDDHNYDYY